MDQVAQGMSEAGPRAAGQAIGSPEKAGTGALGRADATRKSSRKPSNTPGLTEGEVEDAKEVLHELEETEGDWSKGR
jgi:hypothetical protein